MHLHATEVNACIVDVKTLLGKRWHADHEGIARKVKDAEDFYIACLACAEYIGQVVDPAQYATCNHNLHSTCVTSVVRNVGKFYASGFFKLKRCNVVADKRLGPEEVGLPGLALA